MKPIEERVTSLELSKKLKEVGVPQESLFWYLEDDPTPFQLKIGNEYRKPKNAISAYLASELLDWLPRIIYKKDICLNLEILHIETGWTLGYRETISGEQLDYFDDLTLSNACAQMLIHLIEKGLVKPEDLKCPTKTN